MAIISYADLSIHHSLVNDSCKTTLVQIQSGAKVFKNHSGKPLRLNHLGHLKFQQVKSITSMN
ncbi:MAG: hypothetical protein LBU14_00965 [Candidatus Peribacteria bacterium]|jgi:hypothetical protein|nr:hypothetical protein [Candidatus Peribacteria bacterium]